MHRRCIVCIVKGHCPKTNFIYIPRSRAAEHIEPFQKIERKDDKMKKFVSLLLALLMVASLAACGKKADNPSNTDKDTNSGSKTLVMGTSADYAPFEFMYKGKDGTMQYGGIDVSVAQYIADNMGKELKVENMSFDYLLPSLVKGDFDIVIAAMEADGERLKSADFSDPYYTDLPPAILVKAADAASYKTLADFSGKSVAGQTGTTKLDIVKEKLTGANAVPLQLVTDMVNELVNGKVDAIVVDGAVAKQYAETNKDLVIADASSELGAAQPYCVAVAKGDPKGLLPSINAAIAKMNEENKLESFISAADALKDVWQEVTPENPS